jgi:hypothetical protein
MMRRRTLVNLDIRDASGETMTMPGLRLTQQLDQAILLAAAAACDEEAAKNPHVRRFVRDAIAGSHVEVARAYTEFDRAVAGNGGDFPEGLSADPLFSAMVNRFRHSFTLYAFFADSPGSAHRLVRISFDEPTTWLYQTPSLLYRRPDRVLYQPGEPRRGTRGTLTQFWASLGIAPTRMRFQIPGAENAASYHFEITMPPGVQIASATLLAGRPNEASRRVSVDRIVGHSPTVGLHAVEVPGGALCRVQVELRATPRGWLTSMMFATLAAFLVVLSVGYHWGWPNSRFSELSNDQITNVVVILVTASAAVATLVTQRDHGDVGSRFVAGVRAFGIAAMALPAVTATVLVYRGIRASGNAVMQGDVLRTLTLVSFVPFAVVFAAWFMSLWSERTRIIEESPWDMTRKHPEALPTNYTDALYRYGFDRPAVGVSSAEGWHEVYDWSDDKHRDAVASLVRLGPDVDPDACGPRGQQA